MYLQICPIQLQPSHPKHGIKHLFGLWNIWSFRISCGLFTPRTVPRCFPTPSYCLYPSANLVYASWQSQIVKCGSAHHWLLITPHTMNSPDSPRTKGNLHPKMPQSLFSKHNLSTTLMAMIRYLQKKKIREYKCSSYDPLLCGSLKSMLTILFSLPYITHTSIIQPNATKVKHMEGFLIKWNKIWLSAEQIKILPTEDYFLAQFLLSTPGCSVVSLPNRTCQK